VEAGQVHEQSKADYKHWPTWTKRRQKTYSTPFYYRARQFWIPAADSGATWFAVTARSVKDPKDPGGLLIFDKVGGRYKMTAAVASTDALRSRRSSHRFANRLPGFAQ
jgi:hypothetical protein